MVQTHMLAIIVPPLSFDRIVGIAGLIGLIIGAASLCLTYYVYKRGEKVRRPTFSIEEPRKLAINKGVSTYKGFTVLYDGKELPKDQHVVSMVIRFWNSGRLEIEAKDVQSPFRATFPPHCRLLDAFVSNSTRPEINAKISRTTDADSDSIVLSADIFEPDDGMSIATMYCGVLNTPITFSGSCTGAHVPSVVQGDLVRDFPLSITWNKLRRTFQPMLATIVFGVFVSYFVTYKGRGSSYVFWTLMSLFCLIAILALVAIVTSAMKTKKLPDPLMRKQ